MTPLIVSHFILRNITSDQWKINQQVSFFNQKSNYLYNFFQLVILAVLGCCVFVNSASLSADPKIHHRSMVPVESLDNDSSSVVSNVRRWKRSGGGGSGGFLAGIGSAILGKVAEASSGASSGSSSGSSGREHQYESVEYGPPVHNVSLHSFFRRFCLS